MAEPEYPQLPATMIVGCPCTHRQKRQRLPFLLAWSLKQISLVRLLSFSPTHGYFQQRHGTKEIIISVRCQPSITFSLFILCPNSTITSYFWPPCHYPKGLLLAYWLPVWLDLLLAFHSVIRRKPPWPSRLWNLNQTDSASLTEFVVRRFVQSLIGWHRHKGHYPMPWDHCPQNKNIG